MTEQRKKYRRGLVGYLPVNSTMQRVSPPTKVLIFFLTSVAISFAYLHSLLAMFVILVMSAVMFAFARLSGLLLKLVVLLLTVGAWGTFVTYDFFPFYIGAPTQSIVFQAGWLIITGPAIIRVTFVVLTFLSTALITLFLVGASTERDIVDGVSYFKVPRTVSIGLGMIFRMAGLLFVDYDTVREAQLSRGVDYHSGGASDRIRKFFQGMIPLIVLATRRASFAINALDSRGFGSKNVHRTNYREIRMKTVDYIILIPFVVIFVVSIISFFS